VPAAARRSSLMRAVNLTMRELSGSFQRSEPIPFVCECDNLICFSVVWMSADVFDAAVAGHTGWVVVEGHEPSSLWHAGELPPTPGADQDHARNPRRQARSPTGPQEPPDNPSGIDSRERVKTSTRSTRPQPGTGHAAS
jgi:hypothetical protein